MRGNEGQWDLIETLQEDRSKEGETMEGSDRVHSFTESNASP